MGASPESNAALAAGAFVALAFGSMAWLSAEAVLFLFLGLLLGGALGVDAKLRWSGKSGEVSDATLGALSRGDNVRGVGGESANEGRVRPGEALPGFQLRQTPDVNVPPRRLRSLPLSPVRHRNHTELPGRSRSGPRGFCGHARRGRRTRKLEEQGGGGGGGVPQGVPRVWLRRGAGGGAGGFCALAAR